MRIEWSQNSEVNSTVLSAFAQHILLVFEEKYFSTLPFGEALAAKLARAGLTAADLAQKPVTLEWPDGRLVSLVQVEASSPRFALNSLLRSAVKPLLEEHPVRIAIGVYAKKQATVLARQAAYVTLVNAQALPVLKKKHKGQSLREIGLFGVDALDWTEEVTALVAGNTVCRALTMTPPNMLTPSLYQQCLQSMASEKGWQYEVFDIDRLRALGAGAFVAVAQGSEPQDAAIVRLSYRHPQAKKTLALVGKGICFDTGGHNLKSAKYMQGMHQDMNGSAVAVGVLQAISAQQLAVNVDCWLALAQNHIGPNAYKQNDVVTALNGMTIEIVHTDAEGRMVLADTLTLASRSKPDVILDYATLTGSMQTALGSRMSGIIANQHSLAQQMVEAGTESGERVVAFPYAEDYDSELDSEIADIKQCTMDSDADHMLAARFLGKFIEHEVDWCHIDLSSYTHKDGLGAVASEVNGFGVALTLQWLKKFLASKAKR
ncbi:leucyl aminopeptidase family protein [Methylophilus sp. YYY-1]|uniref:M17 family metallopeptidase n=1 Tax=Methylophilus sp. YYY-1 TaxID=2682087 RepID=UPI0023B2B467|nr:leucyl aminopeptidase family protein [Methylophilus sp. YYY-1]MDF0378507.1 leucyl aminopeptidase family protein [Methylophilus sp. YYY-1]